MAEKLKRYESSIWRVPLISIIGGFFYAPLYVQIVVRFGVMAPGRIDDGVTLAASGGILLSVLVLGGALLLRKQSRKEIFVSAGVVFVYGILVCLIQMFVGNIKGSAAVIFMYLFQPLEWTGFFSELFSYLQDHFQVSLPIIWWFRFFVPFIFVLFGRKQGSENERLSS